MKVLDTYHTTLATFMVQDVNQTTVESYTITSTAHVYDTPTAPIARYFYVRHTGRRGDHVTDHPTYASALTFILEQTGWGEATITIPSEES